MVMQELSNRDRALRYARIAGEAFQDQADYFLALPDDAWDGPTGAEKWNMHELAGHALGEAVWFPNLIRGVTQNEPPLPNELWEQLKQLPGKEIGERMSAAAGEMVPAVETATPEQIELPASLGWMEMPLWQAVYVGMMEAVYHNWDGRARREPGATIPTPWAQALATLSVEAAAWLARQEAAEGRYLLEVGDGVGPVTVTASEGSVRTHWGREGTPDVTLHLTADQYVRLLAGRLPLPSAIKAGEMTVEGDRGRAEGLNRIFAGIAN